MPAADQLDVANAETDLQQRIRLALGMQRDLRLFRNQVGQLPDPRTGRPVQFGLARGSADLIGWRTVVITPEMVGQRVAIFTSLEVKTPTGRLTPAQTNWLGVVRGAGGLAGVARSVRDADEILRSVANLPTSTQTSTAYGSMNDNPPSPPAARKTS